MSEITYTTPLNYRSLMNKSKSDLAHLVMDYARWLHEETERNSPRSAFGIAIICDKNIPSNVAEFRDSEGNILGKIEL